MRGRLRNRKCQHILGLLRHLREEFYLGNECKNVNIHQIEIERQVTILLKLVRQPQDVGTRFPLVCYAVPSTSACLAQPSVTLTYDSCIVNVRTCCVKFYLSVL
jgi:hypothetical protein